MVAQTPWKKPRNAIYIYIYICGADSGADPQKYKKVVCWAAWRCIDMRKTILDIIKRAMCDRSPGASSAQPAKSEEVKPQREPQKSIRRTPGADQKVTQLNLSST